MSKVIQRLLTFFIGIPLVLGIVFLNPWANLPHLPINALCVLVSALAACELYNIFSVKIPLLSKPLIVILSAIMPLIAFLLVSFGSGDASTDIDYTNWAFLISAMILMGVEVFSHRTFEDSNKRLSASVFIVFYCGFLFTFITRITTLKESTVFLSLFLFTVFMNDSMAWLFGVLLGKNNRNIFAASPNKSFAGFLGGYVGAVASCVAAQIIFKDIFQGPLYYGVILGFLCASASITGDLIESVFKRSAGIKDSGNIIPGRGGILDSIDSILFTAPIFYVVTYFLFNLEFIAK